LGVVFGYECVGEWVWVVGVGEVVVEVDFGEICCDVGFDEVVGVSYGFSWW